MTIFAPASLPSAAQLRSLLDGARVPERSDSCPHSLRPLPSTTLPVQPAPQIRLGAHGPSRGPRHGGGRRRRAPRRPVLRDASTRRLVLRHARRPSRLARHGRHAASGSGARAGLRRAHPLDPGLARILALPEGERGLSRQTRRPRRRGLGRAPPLGPPVVQPGRLHLRRPGRDGEPQHQSVRLRAQRPRLHALQQLQRLVLGEQRVPVRSELPRCSTAASTRPRATIS